MSKKECDLCGHEIHHHEKVHSSCEVEYLEEMIKKLKKENKELRKENEELGDYADIVEGTLESLERMIYFTEKETKMKTSWTFGELKLHDVGNHGFGWKLECNPSTEAIPEILDKIEEKYKHLESVLHAVRIERNTLEKMLTMIANERYGKPKELK